MYKPIFQYKIPVYIAVAMTVTANAALGRVLNTSQRISVHNNAPAILINKKLVSLTNV